MSSETFNYISEISVTKDGSFKKETLEKIFRSLEPTSEEYVENVKDIHDSVRNPCNNFNPYGRREVLDDVADLQCASIDSALQMCSKIHKGVTDIIGTGIVDFMKSNENSEKDIEEFVLKTIKNNGKINISYLTNDYDPYTTIFFNDHDITVDVETDDGENDRKINIPNEFCEFYSPTDNVYYIILESLKRIDVKKDNEYCENRWINYYTNYTISSFDKIDIMYKDKTGDVVKGYVRIESNIEEINVFRCRGKDFKDIVINEELYGLYAIKQFYEFFNEKEKTIWFNIKMFNEYDERINEIKYEFVFNKDNKFDIVIDNSQKIDIFYVGEIRFDYNLNYCKTHFPDFKILDGMIETRTMYIQKGFKADCEKFVTYLKNLRKFMVRIYNENKCEKTKAYVKNLNDRMKSFIHQFYS